MTYEQSKLQALKDRLAQEQREEVERRTQKKYLFTHNNPHDTIPKMR